MEGAGTCATALVAEFGMTILLMLKLIYESWRMRIKWKRGSDPSIWVIVLLRRSYSNVARKSFTRHVKVSSSHAKGRPTSEVVLNSVRVLESLIDEQSTEPL